MQNVTHCLSVKTNIPLAFTSVHSNTAMSARHIQRRNGKTYMSYHKTRNGNGTSALVTDAKDYASRHPACSVLVCGMLIWEEC